MPLILHPHHSHRHTIPRYLPLIVLAGIALWLILPLLPPFKNIVFPTVAFRDLVPTVIYPILILLTPFIVAMLIILTSPSDSLSRPSPPEKENPGILPEGIAQETWDENPTLFDTHYTDERVTSMIKVIALICGGFLLIQLLVWGIVHYYYLGS